MPTLKFRMQDLKPQLARSNLQHSYYAIRNTEGVRTLILAVLFPHPHSCSPKPHSKLFWRVPSKVRILGGFPITTHWGFSFLNVQFTTPYTIISQTTHPKKNYLLQCKSMGHGPQRDHEQVSKVACKLCAVSTFFFLWTPHEV